MRTVDDSEDALWEPGDTARVLGWGQLSLGGLPSDLLRQADVPILTPERCENAYGDQFDAALMVCAAPIQTRIRARRRTSASATAADRSSCPTGRSSSLPA